MNNVLFIISIILFCSLIVSMLLANDKDILIHNISYCIKSDVEEYSKIELEQLESEAEYVKRAREYFDNPENLKECQ